MAPRECLGCPDGLSSLGSVAQNATRNTSHIHTFCSRAPSRTKTNCSGGEGKLPQTLAALASYGNIRLLLDPNFDWHTRRKTKIWPSENPGLIIAVLAGWLAIFVSGRSCRILAISFAGCSLSYLCGYMKTKSLAKRSGPFLEEPFEWGSGDRVLL